MDVIPLKLRHSKLLGGGFHCITLDVPRRGTLQRYFEWMARKEGVTTRAALTLAVASMLVASTMATTAFADSQATRVQIRYEPPKDPEHGQIYEELERLRALEKLQEFLSPFRLPRTLTIMLAGCDGEADAFYGDDETTICYEYVDALWKNMPPQTTPGGVAPIDTVFGPLFDTSLHEFAHALFDMLNLPVLGREDAFQALVGPHIDQDLAREVFDRAWLGEPFSRRPR